MGSFASSITNANGHLDASYPRNVECYYDIAQDIENNTSTLSWRLFTGSCNNSAHKVVFSNVSLNINGSNQYFNGSHIMYACDTFISNGTITIPHNSDGTKTISVSLEAGIYEWAVNSTYSGSIELPRIPKQADLTAADNFNDEQNPTIKYSNRAGNAVDSLQATIKWNGGALGWRDVPKTAGSYTFNLSGAERNKIRSAMANTTSMTITFSLYTKVGSKEYYSNLDKTVSIVNASPTLNPTVEDSNQATLALTGDKNTIITGASTIKFNSGAQAHKGASISDIQTTCGDEIILGGDGIITNATSNIVKFWVVDSRGLTAEQTITKKVINYIPLTCAVSTSVELTGETTATVHIHITGNYFKGSFGSKSNSLQVQYGWKKQGATAFSWNVINNVSYSGNSYTANVDIPNIDYRDTFVVQGWAKDVLNAVYTSETVVKSKPVFYWGKDEFNVNGKFNVNGSIYQNGKEFGGGSTVLQQVYPVGSIYLSVNNTNPNTLFGFGSWKRLENRFLVGAGGSYSGGATGGAETHTHGTKGHAITVNEMAKHRHEHLYAGNNSEGMFYNAKWATGPGGGGSMAGFSSAGSDAYWYATGYEGGGAEHSHGDTYSASSIPPYLAVYMWQRTG